jgi:uncharacterized cupin superfamily protein
VNLFEPTASPERTVGEEFGAVNWGATLYELAPGSRTGRYHWHFGEEEWLVVVSGAPTLRTPEGERRLRPWDAVVFVRGEAGAHEIRNDTDERVRVLVCSSTSDPEVTVYPDDAEVAVFADWSRAGRGEMALRAPYTGRRT